ncbi:PDC sensor domain-containing protein [Pararhizobium antarcticum]|uniref:Uncharacterized protein n=1 Tax=Pararhizobium antarcticum TaxID=1798805 RepID=A0A657M0E8_9HYPH|nr:PDC sensor domain-containing protein [Pararhizobium antarcticum]OJG00054.1 hypothetical protein AX761_09255 [Rhizobium sp. 58]OJG01544.1 hypothetical protein AX760_01125 [Pararhizobium antarcticum]
MTSKKIAVLVASAAIFLSAGIASAEEAYVAPVKDYLETNVKTWINDPVIIEAIKAQNAANAALTQADVDALDQKWRAEVEGSDRAMIDGVLANAVSALLKAKQEASDGTITEVFVMDAKGLNVGQNDVTSDYWQGDEDKFQKSFGAGAGAVFVDEAEKDESTQILQSQASMTIVDEAGAPIGAVTIGINLDSL